MGHVGIKKCAGAGKSASVITCSSLQQGSSAALDSQAASFLLYADFAVFLLLVVFGIAVVEPGQRGE